MQIEVQETKQKSRKTVLIFFRSSRTHLGENIFQEKVQKDYKVDSDGFY